MLIAICDDECISLQRCKRYLEKYSVENKVSITLKTFLSGRKLMDDIVLNAINYDALFLDIKMKPYDGITIAKTIRKNNKHTPIVFTTSFVEYAYTSYKVNAFNYLLKPLNYTDIVDTLNNILSIYYCTEDYITVKNYDCIRKLYINDIYYIEIEGHNVRIHMIDKAIISHKKIKYYENLLEKHFFVRCHESYLVNTKYVVNVTGNALCMLNKATIPISKSRKKQFMNVICEQSIRQ